MNIQNKYEIGDLVSFGSYMSIVTGIRITGKPLNILYEISFFDSMEQYKTVVLNDFEIELEKNKFGFKGEKNDCC